MTENNDNQNNNQINETDEKMAVKFPDWDLLPPDTLIKRSNNE